MNITRNLAVTTLLATFAVTSACAGPERATRVDTDKSYEDANRRLEEGQSRQSEEGGSAQAAGVNDREPVAQAQPGTSEGGAGAEGGEPVASAAPDRSVAAAGVPDWQAVVDDFADQLIGAKDRIRGDVVLFPAFGRNAASNRFFGSAMGDRVARRIEDRLVAEDLEVLGGIELQAAIQQVNFGLDSLVDDASAWQMGRRLADFRYVGAVVTGRIEEGQRSSGLGAVRPITLRLEARQLRSGRSLARAERTWTGGSARTVLAGQLAQAGDWRIGDQAPTFRPDADLELSLVALKSLTSILDEEPDFLVGRRVQVSPLDVNGSTHSNELQRVARTIHRRLAQIESAMAGSGTDQGTFDRAMAAPLSPPLQVGNVSAGTLEEAFAAYERQRDGLADSRAGRVAASFAEKVGEALRRLTDGKTEIVRPDERRLVLGEILSNSIEYQAEGALDPESIAWLQTNAADTMIYPTLVEELEGYVMRVKVVRMNDSNQQISRTVDLPDWLVARLVKVFG